MEFVIQNILLDDFYCSIFHAENFFFGHPEVKKNKCYEKEYL